MVDKMDDPKPTPVKVCSCKRAYSAAEWERLPLVDPVELDSEDLEVRTCSQCGAHIDLVTARVFDQFERAWDLAELADKIHEKNAIDLKEGKQ